MASDSSYEIFVDNFEVEDGILTATEIWIEYPEEQLRKSMSEVIVDAANMSLLHGNAGKCRFEVYEKPAFEEKTVSSTEK